MNRLLAFAAVALLALPLLAGPVPEDFTDPQKCVQTFLSILAEGDLDQIDHCFTAPTAGQSQPVSFSSDDNYAFFIERVLAERFGEQNVPATFNTRGRAEAARAMLLRTGNTSIISDSGARLATFDAPGANFRIVMAQEGNQWKIVRDGNKLLLDLSPRGQTMRAWCNQVMRDIRAGKWTTATEAANAIEQSRRQAKAAGAEAAAAATRPSR